MTNLFSMMAELMRPPTEEEAAMMMSMMEELMKPPTEEEMAEMEQGKNVQTNIILQLSAGVKLVFDLHLWQKKMFCTKSF